MSLLKALLEKFNPSLTKPSGEVKTSGKIIAEVTGGANLVDGKQTWEYAEEKKHDIDIMLRCCEAELKSMRVTGLGPAPYYFERVAILARKQRKYVLEVSICEKYIIAVDAYYKGTKGHAVADVRKGPRYQAIVKRLPKAKKLLAESSAT